MKILVAGLGSIGHRHIRNLKIIAPDAEIGVWRQRSKEADLGNLAPLVSQVFFAENDALAWGADAALVTNPATLHIDTGTTLALAGMHLFIEKPLSHTLTGVERLISICEQKSLALMVGYDLRFFAPLQRVKQLLDEGRIGRPLGLRAEVGQYLPDWRPGRDYRDSVTAQRDLGGGVILELSHELDYAYWLLGEVVVVNAMMGCLGGFCIDVEDSAEITLEFASGAVGSVHLDMVQRAPTRMGSIHGTEGVVSWDILRHQVQLYAAETGDWQCLHSESKFDFNQVYIAELGHFLACVSGDADPPVDGNAGRRVLEIALAAKRSSEERRQIPL